MFDRLYTVMIVSRNKYNMKVFFRQAFKNIEGIAMRHFDIEEYQVRFLRVDFFNGLCYRRGSTDYFSVFAKLLKHHREIFNRCLFIVNNYNAEHRVNLLY